jgi:hypothetical protein
MSEGWKQVWTDLRHTLRESGLPGSDIQETQEQEHVEAEEQRVAEQEIRPQAPALSLRDISLPRWIMMGLMVGLGLGVVFFGPRFFLTENQLQPSAPNVVATYDGGQITREDLRQHLSLLVPDAYEQRQFRHVEDYRCSRR